MTRFLLAAALLLTGCTDRPPADHRQSSGNAAENEQAQRTPPAGAPEVTPTPVAVPAPSRETGWDHQASGEGDGLSLTLSGRRLITFFCPAQSEALVVNVPSFEAIASEERMSIGAGGTVVTLVADFRGDRARGGVTGTGPVPAELEEIMSSPAGIAVNYGAQNAGPFTTVPSPLVAGFLAGCRD